MRGWSWGLLVLPVMLCLPARPSCAAEPEGWVGLTTDHRCTLYDWGMVAPVTGRIALYRRLDGGIQQLIVVDADGGNEVTVDQVGYPRRAIWAPDGTTLAYTWQAREAADLEQSVKTWRYGERDPRTLAKGLAAYSELTWSPDGQRLAARKDRPESDRIGICIFDPARGRETEIAPNHWASAAWKKYCVSWAPDSSQCCFAARETQDDTWGLWVCRADGTHLSRLTPRDCEVSPQVTWSPNGEWIAFTAHYKRVESETWYQDLWVVRPSGKDLHPLTQGSSQDWRHRTSYQTVDRWTPDSRYVLLAREYYPDPARQDLAPRFCWVDAQTEEIIPAMGSDIAGNRRESRPPYWEASPDGRRLFTFWQESEIHNLGTENETLGTTWYVGALFEMASRRSRELIRLDKEATHQHLTGWPGFSPDGRRIYFSVRRFISKEEDRYDADTWYIDLGQEAETAPASPVEPAPGGAEAGDEGAIRLPVMNLSAQEALALLADRYEPFVKVDERGNCLLLTAPAEMRAAIERDLRTVDVAAPQIAVEVLVIELSKQGARDLGLDLTYSRGRWAALVPVGQSSRLGPTDEEGIPLLPGNPAGLGEVIYQGVGELPKMFFAHLQALEASGDARIEASPTVVATSGQEASITVRQRVNFFYTTGYDVYGRPTLAKSDISADINMKILPVLLGNGKVLVEVDALVGSFTFKAAGALPDTTERQVATSLTVGDGQTIVLGGLKQWQTTTSYERVPVLSEIPLLGKLFQRKSRRSTENVLTVFITPRVVSPDSAAAAGLPPRPPAGP